MLLAASRAPHDMCVAAGTSVAAPAPVKIGGRRADSVASFAGGRCGESLLSSPLLVDDSSIGN